MAKISFGQLFAGAVALTYCLSSGNLRFAGTNIPPPLLRRGNEVTELKTRGLPLGSGMVEVTTASITLLPGDSLVLYSDGWLDGITADPAEILLKTDPLGTSLAEALAPEGPLTDDLTLIVLQREEHHGV